MKSLVLIVLVIGFVLATTLDEKTLSEVDRIQKQVGENARSLSHNELLFYFLDLMKNLATDQTKAIEFVHQNATIKELSPYILKPTLMAVLLTPGELVPREVGSPYITLDEELRKGQRYHGVIVPYMNTVAESLEKALGHPLTRTMHIGLLHPEMFTGYAQDLWAIFDYKQGQLLLKEEIVAYFEEQMNDIPPIDELGNTFQLVLDQMPKKATISEMVQFVQQVPMIVGQSFWTCYACAVILGTALPIIYNYAIDWISQEICEWYKFSPDQCVQLRVEALMFALVLVIPAAFIVFKVCKLSTCHASTQAIRIVGGSLAAYIKGGL